MPRSAAQTRRMIPIASISASTDSGPDRTGPPQAPIPSQNAPAPRPSSTRPPLSRSSVAADLARSAGWRRGRLATSGKKRTVLGAPGEVGEQRPCVEVAALVRVVLDADQVEPQPVGEQHLLDDGVLALRVGDREDAEQGFHRAVNAIRLAPWRDGSSFWCSWRSCRRPRRSPPTTRSRGPSGGGRGGGGGTGE